MKTLTCIAKITAQDQHKAIVLEQLSKIIAPTLREKGCINYDLHIDNENDAVFFFHENWQSGQDLDAHLESAHIKACFGVIGEMLDSVEISRMSKVSA